MPTNIEPITIEGIKIHLLVEAEELPDQIGEVQVTGILVLSSEF